MTLDELALAYELHVAGCTWKRIAIGIGHPDPDKLYAEVRHLRRHGFNDSRRHAEPWQIEAAETMREHSRLSWNAIARHVGMSTSAIINAVWRHKKARREAGQPLEHWRVTGRSGRVRPGCR